MAPAPSVFIARKPSCWKVPLTDPYFTSTSKTYQAKLGTSVSFHCQVIALTIHITISFPGCPKQVSITSPHNSHKAEEYVLTWEAISLLRITEYRILYRLHRAATR